MTHDGDGPSLPPGQTGGFVDERVIRAWHPGIHPSYSAFWARSNRQFPFYTAWDSGAEPVLPWYTTSPPPSRILGPLGDHRPEIEIVRQPGFLDPRSVVVEAAPQLPQTPPVLAAPPLPVVEWLEALSVFIPRSIREPALGDLLEDVERMRTRGSSKATMWWAIFSQLALLALRRLIPRWLRP